MNLRSFLLGALLIGSLTTVGYIVFAKGKHSQPPQQGFTLTITNSAYPANGTPFVSGTTIRYQRGDGSWKKITTLPDGRVDVGYGQPGRGVFEVNEKEQKLIYIGPSSGTMPSEDQLRKDPKFVGEETVLGYRTLHLHFAEPNGQYTDTYFCPDLQGYPLKTVTVSSNGSRTVWETTKVTPGEPAFEAIPNYPVDETRFKAIHNEP